MLSLALGLGLITAIANVLGSGLAVMQRQPSRKFTAATLGFSGGFILAAALMEMVPASVERGQAMPGFIALGYVVIFLIEQFLNVHLHTLPDETNPTAIPVAAGVASLVAFNVHDFVDGLAMGAGMIAETRLGIMVFLAVVLHEIPAGFVIAAIMRGAGWGRWGAIGAGGSLGIITLIGIALPFWVQASDSFFSDALLALATGTFVYLGATLLVPLSEAGRSRSIPLLVVLGFVAFWATNRLVGR
jgi:zinc transporter ZupT